MSVVELESREITMEAPSGLWKEAWGRLRRNPGAIIGAGLVVMFIVIALAAPVLAPYGPRERAVPLSQSFDGPSRGHLLGIDGLGRDELSRIIYGGRYSLLIG